MTKILLTAINAKYIHSNPAVYSLKAYADRRGVYDIEIAEYTVNNRAEKILSDLYQRKPEVIAFSCYIWNIALVEELICEIKKLLPAVCIWAGGPEVSYGPDQACRNMPGLAGVMVGEGEKTFAELAAWYESSAQNRYEDSTQKLHQIRGLYLPGTGSTGAAAIPEMADLPFLYETAAKEQFENRILYYETSRGCPFRCSYCLSSIDKTVRFRPLEQVYTELRFFLDRKVPQVKFIDRTFNCNKEHAVSVWRYLKEHDNGVTNFHFEIAADLLDGEEIALLNSLRPGQVQLEIGVQTTNAETLAAIERKTDLARLKAHVEAIRLAGNIHQHLDLIAGLPFEDFDSFERSFCEVYAMRPNQLQLGFLKVLQGSKMYDTASEYGIVCASRAPYEVRCTKWLPYEKLLLLKEVEEMVELYYNSGQFAHILPVLEQAFENPFRMFLAMARYYDEKGYFVNSPARSYRYRILLDFAAACDGGREELYRELGTFDLYLRENAKSRPDFARDRKQCTALCPRQPTGETHAEPFFYPVWETEREAQRSRREKPAVVVFDYRHRNPLDQSAAWHVLRQGRRQENYIAIDLETTGLQPKLDSIIEIGAARVENGVVTACFETFVKPCRKVSQRITELTGIAPADVTDAPSVEEVLPKLLAFIGELPLLGHSVLFDYSFLKRAAVSQKLPFEKKDFYTPEMPINAEFTALSKGAWCLVGV